MFQADLLLNGQTTAASNGATFERRNPATGEVATRAAAATLDDVDAAVAAAQAAFPAWSTMAPGARRTLLLKAADKMEALRGQFVEAAVAECGGAPMWYQFNVTLASNMLREAVIELANKLLEKNPVVLRYAKIGFKRCRELTWEQGEDYLYAKTDQSNQRDPEKGRKEGLKQFLDDKTIKPGLQTYKRPK